MENQIAVFTRDERSFREMELSPTNMFVRIRNINDCRGRRFIGIIRCYGWYKGQKEITEAYDHLRVRQPEIFDTAPRNNQ